ncbi:hypothetical protein AB4Y77_21350 [Paenarthrobacter sp. YAF11_1]|uniref:hypothetical protein n=1 Tax=Paenarthrobacter sp. YAF11_1 TaxID=3233074 RepID=UPI003F96C607
MPRKLPLIITFYSAGLFFLIGPYASLLFVNSESFPVNTRATGGSIINAAGQIGAIIGCVLIRASLSAGMSWTGATFWWGVIPIIASGILILAARNVDPRKAPTD